MVVPWPTEIGSARRSGPACVKANARPPAPKKPPSHPTYANAKRAHHEVAVDGRLNGSTQERGKRRGPQHEANKRVHYLLARMQPTAEVDLTWLHTAQQQPLGGDSDESENELRRERACPKQQ
eukprot:scaffold13930_cov65-Phaeocystis_antarctica.AAC.7